MKQILSCRLLFLVFLQPLAGISAPSTAIKQGSASLPPVFLVSFSGKQINHVISLKWQTSDEIDASHFHVQRSTNGVTFHTIARIDNHTTTRAISDYSFTDSSVITGEKLWYRLEQVDKSGRVNYSKIIAVNTVDPGIDFLKLAPNPTTKNIYLMVGDGNERSGYILITNHMGTVVKRENIILYGNARSAPIDVSGLPSGNYFVRVFTSDLQLKQRFVKQ